MEKQPNKSKNWIYALVAGIGVIIAGRWLPHPPNFTPMIGSLLFCAAFFKRKQLHFIVPIVGLWLSDLFLNNLIYTQYFEGWQWMSQPFLWSAAAFVIIAALSGLLMRHVHGWKGMLGLTLLATMLFFVLSNFGAWMASPQLYSRDVSGLITAYIAALPFAVNSLLGNLFYVVGFFGVYYMLDRPAFGRKFSLVQAN